MGGGCRDIKPENIFLTGSHRFKMGDLGLAICIAEELPFTRSGTLDYMAPEVYTPDLSSTLDGALKLDDPHTIHL